MIEAMFRLGDATLRDEGLLNAALRLRPTYRSAMAPAVSRPSTPTATGSVPAARRASTAPAAATAYVVTTVALFLALAIGIVLG